eukprot:264263-Rhodomonas_salina.1
MCGAELAYRATRRRRMSHPAPLCAPPPIPLPSAAGMFGPPPEKQSTVVPSISSTLCHRKLHSSPLTMVSFACARVLTFGG